MQDRYASFATGLESPVTDGFSITPHDTDPLPELTRALYVGSAGTLSVELASGATVVLAGAASGTILPIRVARVHATATTAGAIVGLV